MRPVFKNLLLLMFVVALIPFALFALPLLAARLLTRHLAQWTRGNAPSRSVVLARSSRRGSAPGVPSDEAAPTTLRRLPGEAQIARPAARLALTVGARGGHTARAA